MQRAIYVKESTNVFKAKTRWGWVTAGICTAIILGAYIGHVHAEGTGPTQAEGGRPIYRDADNESLDSGTLLPDCKKTDDGTYRCASEENIKKWEAFLKEETEAAKIEARRPTTILTKVCHEQGLNDANCPKILYAMAQQESYFGKVMSGDGGKSHGYFHIMFYHNVPTSCSEDLACSARWTLKRMIAKGFKTNRDNAIRLHNGSLDNPLTLTYLKLVKEKMALWPKS